MDLFEQLKNWSKMETREATKLFDQGVSDLAKRKDIPSFKMLIELFNDECPYYEVMYSLVHALESYNNEIYVRELLKNLGLLIDKAPFWADCLFNRLFNNKRCLEIFKNIMHHAPEKELLDLFKLMEKESPHHKKLIIELRDKLN